MNVEEALRRLKDPSEWKLRFAAPGYVAPVGAIHSPFRFAAAVAIALVGVTVVAGIGVTVVNGSTTTPPVAPPASPSAAAQAATPDDNRLAADKYAPLANSQSVESRVAVAGNDSAPWVAITGQYSDAFIFIAYVAGGPHCGEHLGVEVVETGTTVTITAVNAPIDAAAARACKSDPPVEGGEITLDQPLGTRVLMHGALSAPWTPTDRPIETVPGKARVEPELPVQEMPPYAGTATCENLLDDSTLRAFRREDWSIIGSHYTQKILDDHKDDPWMYAFLDYGGIVCAVGGQSTAAVSYAYGPITATQEEEQRKIWDETDATVTQVGTFDVYTVLREDDAKSDGVIAAFGDGQWAFVRDWEAGHHIINDLIRNMPDTD